MQSRRDQVQAYFFVVGRLVSALTHGKPDILDPPNRRFSTAGVLGVLLGALLAGVFWVIGIYVPTTSNAWREPGSIIMDESTGARYVLIDGQLRPVLNFTSAKLVMGGSAAVKSVSSQSLADAPVGVPIGIPGAPDSPPEATGLDTGAWTVCLRLPDDASSSSSVALLLKQNPGAQVPAQQGILVSGPDGTKQLLWQGRRFRFADDLAVRALGYGGAAPLAVPANWLSPIPAGHDIVMPKIAGIGSPGPEIGGKPSTVGQIYEVSNPAINAQERYVVSQDGLTRLNPTTEALLLSDPDTRNAYPNGDVKAITAQPGDLSGVAVSGRSDLVDGYPAPLPSLINSSLNSGASPCVQYLLTADGKAPVTFLSTLPAAVIDQRAVRTGVHTAGTIVDGVAIPKGTGALVRDLPTAGAVPGAEYLITDLGVKFPLQDGNVAATLGYAGAAPLNVPNQLLALLPTGPVLSQTAALAPQPAGKP